MSQYATNVRDIAILVAAALALLSLALSLRTRVDADRGRIVVWRLPLLRHVKVEGQEVRRRSARELAEESDDDDNDSAPAEGDQNPSTSPADASPVDTIKPDAEEQRTTASGWLHIPAAMDRSRDPVDLAMISLRRARRSGRTQLHLRAKRSDQGLLSDFPNIRIDRSNNADDVHVPLTNSDAGRLRDALVGSWVTSLWS